MITTLSPVVTSATTGLMLAALALGAAVPGADVNAHSQPNKSKAMPPTAGVRTPCPRIDVLGIYTTKATQAVGGKHRISFASRAIAKRMNRSLKHSGICGKVRFVTSYTAASYTGPETFAAAYRHLKNPHEKTLGAQAHRLRDQYGADLVVLLIDQEQRGGGKGDYTSTLSPASDEFAYSVADVEGIERDSVSHEWGHNLGLAHDRYTISADPVGRMRISTTRPYNTGWITPDGRYRTIMAYEKSCLFSCEQISRFANPEQTYKGQPLGDMLNDNARVLRETLPIVAGYRDRPPAPQPPYVPQQCTAHPWRLACWLRLPNAQLPDTWLGLL
ncbi:hypothetical protein GCM10010329_81680 [Streptomyces spiroverticillatus]|uniref:Peptidyl-Asp metallopeptidase n=1 Tax=Streptomyces finlayi TaxID=67296 RepID=A0A919CFR0_9ACTN|nr:M12 family metallo-peptidase [Streptomyces finlayi]GHA46765.1 hypothetical protein GCM10010329_81680 [Streptomyces spiroverticillatus]GHD18219.1 hypothetical protein GCM10010334_80760 [Streptomyces finlayi]